MNAEFGFNTEYLKECAKRRKKLEERIYPKKDWPVGYEPTKKEYEEWMEEGTGVPVSFHWEDIGGGRKRGVFTPIKKNMEILTDFEKVLDNGQPVNFQIENSEGKIVKVSKEEFANWMGSEKNVKTLPKESLVYGVSGDIDGLTYFAEKKTKTELLKESYCESWNGKDKNKILEKSQQENSLNSDKKEEKENDRKDFSQKADKQEGTTKKENNLATNQKSSLQNKDNNQNIYYRVGLISLVVLVISVATISLRKRNLKKYNLKKLGES